jgi:hypothetical protein
MAKIYKRNINYLNKDFSQFRAQLVNYAQTYFPTSYNDFSEASPGMMLMEMSAYVGDVLSFYLDNQTQETFTQFARQEKNLFELAYMFGYKPKVTSVATVNLSVSQVVPATTTGSNPDFNYALLIQPNAVVSSNAGGSNFLIEDAIDFSYSSSLDPTEIEVYEAAGGETVSFLLTKTVRAISSTINTTNISAGNVPQEFFTTTIDNDNIIGILDVLDDEGNKWYEVPYLGQELVYDSIKNTNPNDPNNYQNSGNVPYLLKTKQVANRFTTRYVNSGSLQIQFGAGKSTDTTEEVIPNPENVGLGLTFEKDKLTAAYSPTNFIFTNTYGVAPTGNLTVRYLTGGGVSANVPSNTLTTLNGVISFQKTGLSNSDVYFDSLSVNNYVAASGGQDGDTIEEIRQNILSNYSSQQRTVTADDYLVRALSMPPKYGDIAKAYITQTNLESVLPGEIPSSLSLYILTFNNAGKLTTASSTLKQNLQTYLSQNRVIGDSISIKDGFIVNIGVDFEIIVLPEYNNNQVLTQCITALQTYFAINNWQMNQPILLKDLSILLDKIPGVQTVKNVYITNKVGTSLGYSQYAYDIEGATINNVVYPSLDPMIFEVKYPDTDIKGRVVPM